MTEREIAVAVNNGNKGVSAFKTIDAIANAGFESVFIQWYNRNWHPTQEQQLEYVRQKGLKVIFAHLGYQDINDLWLEGKAGDRLCEGYKNDISVCAKNGIPMVVMHLTDKNEEPKRTKIGIDRLSEIVEHAKALEIKVAFENTKFEGWPEYVIENIASENVGFCFDSGHYHVHFDDELDFSRFKDRIFAVHLHDNDKSGDRHLLPFDGTLDWDNVVKELKTNGYTGPVTLEICRRDEYLETDIDTFYKKGYEIGEKLRKMLE